MQEDYFLVLYVHAQCSIFLWALALLKLNVFIHTSVFLSFVFMRAHTQTHTKEPTRAAKLVALDLRDAFVGEATGAGTARSTGLYGV